MTTPSTPTSVYRYYDRLDILIYVGITKQGIGRNLQHNRSAEWWPFVARQDVDHYENREAAILQEKSLISAYRPPFNKNHNPTHERDRTAYLAFVRTLPSLDAKTPAPPRNPIELLSSLRGLVPLTVMKWHPEEGDMRFMVDALYQGITSRTVLDPAVKIQLAGRPGVVQCADYREPYLFLSVRAKGRLPERLALAHARFKVTSQKKPVTFRLASLELAAAGAPTQPRYPVCACGNDGNCALVNRLGMCDNPAAS